MSTSPLPSPNPGAPSERPGRRVASDSFRTRGGLALKRCVDVLGASVLLAATSPLLVAAAAGVALTMGRPVLFRQDRAGLHGRPFALLKLRSMHDVGTGRVSDAERLTPFGRALRATSVDELPGLVNVLRGELSLVGPRPLPVRYLGRYSAEQARRHEVRPGVTGLAQVRGRNAVDWTERLALDVEYVDRRSTALDLGILLSTVGVVLRRTGTSRPGEATMTEFRPETAAPR